MKPAALETAYRLGLIGYPLGHSVSPRLHQAALRAAGMEGSYDLFPVAAGDAGKVRLRGLIDELRAGRLDGLNVTIPHKQSVMALVDDLSPVGRAVGAVNTLYTREGRVIGDNTDAGGFLYDLKQLWQLSPGSALILGAGGSARAVAYALAVEGWKVRVAARRLDQATALVEDLNRLAECGGRLRAAAWNTAELEEQSAALVVNSTPLGMFPAVDGCAWPEELPLPSHACVYDLVYNPQETRLVRKARAQGLPAATGLGMLAAQAALAFALWTGSEPPFKIMAAAAGLEREPQNEGGA